MSGESQREPDSAPDPTVVTTEIIHREIVHLRELIETTLTERDRRYGERFEAQQLAINKAFEAADQAVNAAFEASEKAILKAEVSIEKRADATYVSLQELSRSLSALMPRSEAESRLIGLSEKVDAADKKVERLEALKAGGTEQRTDQRLNIGMLVGLATLFLAVVVVVANYITTGG